MHVATSSLLNYCALNIVRSEIADDMHYLPTAGFGQLSQKLLTGQRILEGLCGPARRLDS